MRRIWKGKVFALAALAAMALWGCSKSDDDSVTNPNPNPLKPTGTVQGLLVDATTRQPIVGAVVDIGVGKATTSETGQFVIRNVPADTYDYPVTIDMRKVSSPVAMATVPAVTPRYPDFAYDSVHVTYSSLNDTEGSNPGGGAGSNHDTPVTGLVANMYPTVGKLSTSIEGVVVKDDAARTPVGANYRVELVNTGDTDFGERSEMNGTGDPNTGTGFEERVISWTTTDSKGAFKFSAVEAKNSFKVRAWDSGKTFYGENDDVHTLGDGTTVYLVAQKSGDDDTVFLGPVVVYPIDDMRPVVVSTSPANNADLAPAANTTVSFTFSEPLASNTYSNALDPSTAAVAGLYNDVQVNYLGAKAGNIAHALSWNSTYTTLTVTIAQTAPSGRYRVDISGATGSSSKLKDAAGNYLSNNSKTVVNFTTNGGPVPVAPTGLQVVNASGVDYDGPVMLDWAVASGAKTYNVYCATAQTWSTTTTVTHQYYLYGEEVPATEFSLEDILLVENNQIPLSALCFVKGVNSDHLEGPASATVTATDKVGPGIDDGSSSIATPAVGKTTTGTVYIYFNEPMDESLADNKANYVIAKNPTARATEITPVITAANYDPDNWTTTLTITLTSAAATDTYEGEWTITAATLKDVAGNTIKSSANFYNNGTEELPTLAVTFTNQSKIDYDGPAAVFDWAPYPQAKSYAWYCEEFELWPGIAPQFDDSDWSGWFNATEASVGPFTLVEFYTPYAIQKFVECQVEARDVNGDAIARSPILTIKDVVKPKLVQPVQGYADIALPAATQKKSFDLKLVMTEPLNEVSAETLANYTIAKNAGAPASDLVPVITSATYNESDTSFGSGRRTVTLKVELDNTAGTGTYSGQWTLTVGAGVTDIAGNAFDTSKAVNNTFSPLTAGTITLTLLDTLAFGPAANPAGNPDFDWLPVVGAASYEVVRNREVGGSLVVDNTIVCSTTIQTFCTGTLASFVSGTSPVTMVYQLFAYDADDNVIAQSNLVKIADTVKPKVSGWDGLGGLSLPSPGAGNFTTAVFQEFTVNVYFDEAVRLDALETLANYTLTNSAAAAPAATAVLPAIVRVDILNNQTARLTLRVTNPAEAAAAGPETSTLYTDLTLNVLNQADVAGNTLDGTADQLYNGPTVPTGVTTNPF